MLNNIVIDDIVSWIHRSNIREYLSAKFADF